LEILEIISRSVYSCIVLKCFCGRSSMTDGELILLKLNYLSISCLIFLETCGVTASGLGLVPD
jgi:hypothetical protein